MSLDGFVSGPQGELNWAKVDQELFDYVGQRIRKGDTALYGRKTYQMMESYWPTAGDKPDASKHDIEHSKWYKNVQKIVLSNSMKGQNLPNTTIVNGSPVERINEIKHAAAEEGEILVFGSPTATHALIQHDLIDGYWLFVNPIDLGKGIALFEDAPNQTKLKLVSSKQFDSGVVELNYLVNREKG